MRVTDWIMGRYMWYDIENNITMWRSNGWRFLILFGKSRVQIAARKPPVIIRYFCGFSKSVQGWYVRLADYHSLSHRF